MKMDSKHLMWLLMKNDIPRYLAVCADGYENGSAKSIIHIHLCDIFIAGYCMCEIERAMSLYYTRWHIVHEATQELTDYMDDEIGFPKKGTPDYEKLSPLFFDKFFDLAKNALDSAGDVVEELSYDLTDADIKEVAPGD
jgi:hypothetical protein